MSPSESIRFEQLRTPIHDLYITQRKPLKEVLAHLKDLGFEPGHKKLARKVQEWGFTKKAKKGSWKTIKLKVHTRKRAGKASVVSFDGRPISPKRQQKELGRYQLNIQEEYGSYDEPPTPDGFAVGTPPAAQAPISHHSTGIQRDYSLHCKAYRPGDTPPDFETALYAAANNLLTYTHAESLLFRLQDDMTGLWPKVVGAGKHAAKGIARALLPAALMHADDTLVQSLIHTGIRLDSIMSEAPWIPERVTWEGLRLFDLLAYTGKLELFSRAFERLSSDHDPSAVVSLKEGALSWAILGGRLDIFKFMIAQEVPPAVRYGFWWQGADMANDLGCTHALTLSASHSKLDIMRFILDYEFSSPISTAIRTKALQTAIRKRNMEAVQILLLRGSIDSVDELCANIFLGRYQAAYELMDAGTSVDATSRVLGGSALQVASRHGNMYTVRYLLSHGAKANIAQTAEFGTPLQEATRRGDVSIFRLLFEATTDFTINGNEPEELMSELMEVSWLDPPINGERPGHHEDDYAIISTLLKKKKSDSRIDQELLYGSVTTGDPRLVKMLLQNDSEVDSHAKRRTLAYSLELAIAKLQAHREISLGTLDVSAYINAMEVLLQAGADLPALIGDMDEGEKIKTILRHICLDPDIAGIMAKYAHSAHLQPCRRCAITRAVRQNDLKCVKQLLETAEACDVNEPCHELLSIYPDDDFEGQDNDDVRYGDLPLPFVGSLGNIEMANYLLAHGAELDGVDSVYGRDSALERAAYNGHLPFVKWAVSRGTDINRRCSYSDMTALEAASRRGHFAVVKFLIDAKADINLQQWLGTTALIYAAEHGHIEIVRLLLDNGADIDRDSNFYGTALCSASKEGYLDIVRLLLERGADLQINQQGAKALERAAQKGRLDIVKLLLDAGAETKGSRALRSAESFGHHGVCDLLREHASDYSAEF